jgi:hypothetical protein
VQSEASDDSEVVVDMEESKNDHSVNGGKAVIGASLSSFLVNKLDNDIDEAIAVRQSQPLPHHNSSREQHQLVGSGGELPSYRSVQSYKTDGEGSSLVTREEMDAEDGDSFESIDDDDRLDTEEGIPQEEDLSARMYTK